jgi:hypothetical protein
MSELTLNQQQGMNILFHASLLSNVTYDYENHELQVPFPLEKSSYFSNLVSYYDLTDYVEIDLLSQTYKLKLPVTLEEKLLQITKYNQLNSISAATIRSFSIASFFTAINLFGKRLGPAIYLPCSLDENSLNRLTVHLTKQLDVLVTRYEYGIKILDIPKLFSLHTHTLPSFDTMQFMHLLNDEDYHDIYRYRNKESKAVYAY